MTLSVASTEPTAVGEIAGQPVALRYSGVESEYAALRRGAVIVDRSHRMRTSFQGERRAETLTGLVTNDVAALAPGSGQYAASLTPRGKIIADVRIFARETELLVDVPVRAAAGWIAMVRKFVNPRLTRYADRSAELADVGLFGPHARNIVAASTGVGADVLASLSAYGHVSILSDGVGILVARVPDLGVEGYELFIPADARARVWRRALELGAVPLGMEAWETARIESGRPEWGLDIDESTIPQEANFDELHAISYTKGCYTGQETVARVHFRGHVNRHLRGLTYPGTTPLPRGAQLFTADDKPVGDVRSSAISPRLGGVAIAMVRREVSPGSSVRVRCEEGAESSGTVLALPFPPDTP
jgi:folate-binding protein YgfZ